MVISLSLLVLAAWLSLCGWPAMANKAGHGDTANSGSGPRQKARPAVQPQGQRSVLTADRSRSFPLRREAGGTRAACASRLVAHLVPETGELDPGQSTLIGLVEGETPRPVELVLRVGARSWPMAPQPRASVRLFQLPQGAVGGVWESFPACEGREDPMAPPARSLLRRNDLQLADGPYQQALASLWRRCGSTVPTEVMLKEWAYAHLIGQLPPVLPVVCQVLPTSP